MNSQRLISTGRRPAVFAAALAACVAVHALRAQGSAASSSASDPATQLEQFVVQGTKDQGYSTTNAIGVTRTNTALIDIDQDINVITRQLLEDTAAGELYDALKYISGVAIESNVGDSVMIRGYTVRDNHTDGFVDNQNQTQAGAEPFMFERLEVLKGPSALVYGSHAIGGVLNRVRKVPLWKPAGVAAFTVGNHDQYKAEFDYSAPLNDKFAYRVVSVWRDESLNNGVETKFSAFHRWNLSPMLTFRPTKKMQIRLSGDFLHEDGFKHWGDAAQLSPFPLNGPTTFGLLPRNFTFSDDASRSGNDKRAGWLAFESQVTSFWSMRVGGTVNHWYHDTVDILPSGIQANNRLMGRTMRYINNNDFNYSLAIDSNLTFDFIGAKHKFLQIAQANETVDDTKQYNGANPPALDIFNPTYGFGAGGLVNPTLANSTHNIGQSRSLSFREQAQWLDGMFQLIGGARYDSFSTRADNRITRRSGPVNQGHNWTYKWGGIYKPIKDLSVYYNYAETFSPNFGSNPDGQTFVPSTGTINEVGVKTALREGRISATISTYDLELKNILALDPDPVRASAGFRVQTAKQTTKGTEADVFINLVPGWELIVGGSTMKITLPTGLKPRNAPQKTAQAWTRYHFDAGRLKGLSFGGGWNWRDRAAGAVDNLVFFPAYDTLDAFVQYGWGKYRFSLNVSNVADKWYLARGINRNIFFQGPERLIKFRVSYSF